MNDLKKEPVPELLCFRKPSKGANNGMYKITIPFKYMLVKETAAFYCYTFVGMKYE